LATLGQVSDVGVTLKGFVALESYDVANPFRVETKYPNSFPRVPKLTLG
jgi:hypothetical protein